MLAKAAELLGRLKSGLPWLKHFFAKAVVLLLALVLNYFVEEGRLPWIHERDECPTQRGGRLFKPELFYPRFVTAVGLEPQPPYCNPLPAMPAAWTPRIFPTPHTASVL